MDPKQDLGQRLAFLGLTGEDQRYLEALRPILEQHADALVGAFYRHLLSFEATRALLSDPAVKERLIRKQNEYLRSLAGSKLDESYLAERARIGERHVEVGLEPRWYLGAYALYFSLLAPVIHESARGDAVRVERTLIALLKVLLLDATIAMEAYIGKRERELENVIERVLALSESREIRPEDLPFSSGFTAAKPQPEEALLKTAVERNLTLREFEDRYINAILRHTGGNKVQAARILGINRRTLYRRGEHDGPSLHGEVHGEA